MADSPEDVVAAVREWRASILAAALPAPPQAAQRRGPRRSCAATAGDPPADREEPRPMKASSAHRPGRRHRRPVPRADHGGLEPHGVLNPSAMLIVLGGTLGATIIGTSFDADQEHPEDVHEGVQPAAAGPQRAGRTSSSATPSPRAATACWPSTRSPSTIEDPFTRKGLQLVVDGTDPDLVADILEAENDAMRKRHAAGRAAVRQGRRLRPDDGHHRHRLRPRSTCSRNLDAPETLGPSISAAFIATLLGVASANVIYLPIATRLKQLSAGGAPRPRADRRGHPLDPGRRQPARRPGEADHLRPAGAARRPRASAEAARNAEKAAA